MGRKLNLDKPASGPGRKARKQPAPAPLAEERKPRNPKRLKKQLQKQQEREKNKKLSRAKKQQAPTVAEDDDNSDADGFFDDEPAVPTGASSEVPTMDTFEGESDEGSDEDGDAMVDEHEGDGESDDGESEADDDDHAAPQNKGSLSDFAFGGSDEENDDPFGEGDDSDDDLRDDFDDMEDDDDDSDDSDVEGPMDMEKASKQLDEDAQEEQRLAEEEMQTNIRDAERFELPSGEEITAIEPGNEDLQNVQMRIRDNLNTLSKFSELRQEGRSRSDYIRLLTKDLAFVYGYEASALPSLLCAVALFRVLPCWGVTVFHKMAPSPVNYHGRQDSDNSNVVCMSDTIV
eukprot:m.750593 g.750593  ORF g.750593 m.750593 type:complete len:346 (+) comp23161_c0_seq4:131-1168(+)